MKPKRLSLRLTAPPRHQRGAVLVVSLVVLMLLTMLGLASMRAATIGEHLAGNLRDRALAFQAAEAALRQGEAEAEQQFAQNNLDALAAQGETAISSFKGVSTAPTFEVEVLATIQTNTEIGPLESEGAVVRVNAHGSGATSDATVDLTSVYLVEE